VQYTDDNGLEKSININFTSLSIINPFLEINNNRCDFTFDDLLELANIVNLTKQTIV